MRNISTAALVMWAMMLLDKIITAYAQACQANSGDLTGGILCVQDSEGNFAAIEFANAGSDIMNSIIGALVEGDAPAGIKYAVQQTCKGLAYQTSAVGSGLSKVTSNSCALALTVSSWTAGFFPQAATVTSAATSATIQSSSTTIGTLSPQTLTSAVTTVTTGLNPTSNPGSGFTLPKNVLISGGAALALLVLAGITACLCKYAYCGQKQPARAQLDIESQRQVSRKNYEEMPEVIDVASQPQNIAEVGQGGVNDVDTQPVYYQPPPVATYS